jgi:hypothetical protein
VVNLPNALSMLRLLSGPVIASWILHGQVCAARSSRRVPPCLLVTSLLDSEPFKHAPRPAANGLASP